jgi:hypothetical protein
MFSSQISKALQKDKYITDYFGGVFPCDKLPKQPVKYPSAFVANTDPSSEDGEHWVCYYFDSEGNADYFDSFGLPPLNCDLHNFFENNGNNHNYNKVQLQGNDSDACGHYCIAVLVNRARGEPLDEIVERYQGSQPGQHDSVISSLVNKKYNITSNNQHGSGYYYNDQCSCCVHSWQRYK